MTATSKAEESPEELGAEVAELGSALRAYLEWCTITGSVGIPADAAAPWEPAPRFADPTPSVAPRARAAAAGAPVGAAPARVPRPVSAPPVATEQLVSRERVENALSVREKLAPIEAEVRTCALCALHQTRTQTVFARGSGSSGLCFVGEGPGADEDARGVPFVGKAGQLLDRMIAAMGLDKDEVYVCNIVKCRPPDNRKPQPAEMAACAPYLRRQLEVLDPTVIVALGATAVEGLLGFAGGITRLRGNWKLYNGRIAVMPTFHPAYLLRNPAAKKDVWEDLQAVLRQLGRPLPLRK